MDTWYSIARLTPGGRGSLALVVLVHHGDGNSDNKAMAGEARQPWLTTLLGERDSDIQHIMTGPCWYCPCVLGHGSLISCYFLSRGAHFGFSGCGVPAFQG